MMEVDKPEIDYTKMAEDAIVRAKQMSSTKEPLGSIVNDLLIVEKKLRLAGQEPEVNSVCEVVLTLIAEAKNWTMLSEQVDLLSRRRAQTPNVIRKIVQKAISYLDDIPDSQQAKIIDDFLEQVTGKIFLEVERVLLTEIKTKRLVKDGKVKEACKLMQGVQIETYGSIDKVKRLDFMLEQIRLLMVTGDFVRMQVIRNKIKEKMLRDQPERCKIYNKLSVKMFLHDEDYLEMSDAYLNIFDLLKTEGLPELKEGDEDDREEKFDSEHFENAVLACILAEDGEGKRTRLGKLKQLVTDRKREGVSRLMFHLISSFTKQEPMIPIVKEIKLRGHEEELFGKKLKFTNKTMGDKDMVELLKKRSIEHNIRIFSLYYSQMRLTRIAEFLDITETEAESAICKLVIGEKLWARIDRLTGVVVFKKPETNVDTLSSWTEDVTKIMELLAKTTELINKETQIYGVKA